MCGILNFIPAASRRDKPFSIVVKRMILLVTCLVMSSLSIGFLAVYINWQNNKSNSFVRRAPPHLYLGEHPTKLQTRGYYIAGVSKNHCYLASPSDWSRLLRVDSSGRVVAVPLKFSENVNVYSNAVWAVDEQHILLLDGLAGEIWQGDIGKFYMRRRKISSAYAKAVSLNNDTYILKTISENRLVFKKVDSSGRITVYPKFLDTIGKGLFAPDGILIKASGSDRLFYTSFYKNKFMRVDKDLKVLYEGNTIDTVAHPQIKTAYLKSSQSLTTASPPRIVNIRAVANNNHLFVQSGLKADNESLTMHEKNVPLDVYQISDGKYRFSFYLPKDISGERLTDLTVLNNRLIALYGQYVFRFRLNF